MHYDEILVKNTESKTARSSRLTKFIKIQNIAFNRIGMFRGIKQYTIEEIGCFERKRRRSWDIGEDGIESLTLQIRAIIHEEDLEFADKIVPKVIQKRESSKTISTKFAFDNSPLCPPPVRRFPNVGRFIKTGSMINGISSKDYINSAKIGT